MSITDAASTAGIPTALLDIALMEAVDTQFPQIDLDYINLVVVAGADVNCLGGNSLQIAARRGSIELLELLVRSAPQPSSLTSAVPVAMRLLGAGLRMKFMVILLDHGAQGPAVDQALAEAIREEPLDENLVFKLLEKANVDHHQGQALCNAVRCATKKYRCICYRSWSSKPSVTLCRSTNRTRAYDWKQNSKVRSGTDQEGLDKALVQEIRNGSNSNVYIIKRLLDYGASCSYDDGKSLELAVISKNSQVLSPRNATPNL